MQPQNPYTTGREAQSVQERGLPPVVPPQATVPAAPSAGPSAPQSGQESTNDSSAEQWVSEVKRVLADTAHNPRMRAEAFAELKLRYQQQSQGGAS